MRFSLPTVLQQITSIYATIPCTCPKTRYNKEDIVVLYALGETKPEEVYV